MTAGTVKYSEVIGMMNDWYVHMRDQEHEQCEEIRKLIDPLVHQEGYDEKVLIYYSLLDFRHQLLLKDHDVVDVVVKIESSIEKMDNVLTYYFYYFKGMHAYGIKRFSEAIEYYKKAEEKLSDLPTDERIERAEFYYKVGAAYFHLDYLNIALQYAKSAYFIFGEVPFYDKRFADSMVLLGQIYADLSDFENASENYHEALKLYEQLNQPERMAIMHQNLGWFYSKMGQHREAVKYFKLFLSGNNLPEYQLRTIFLMVKSYLQYGNRTEAAARLEEGIRLAQTEDNKEFIYKMKILQSEHFSGHEESMERDLTEGIQFFNENHLWDLAQEYAEKLADYYFGKNSFKNSAIYYKMVKDINNRNSIKGL